MKTSSKFALVLPISLLGTSAFAETPHCITSTDGYGITVTQCDDGTVTVANGRTGVATICSAGNGYNTHCEKVNTGGGNE